VSDRVVEPFLISNEGLDARCYEVASHMNKTFKTTRMGSVEIIDVPWIHEEKHKEIFTDIFGFSGEEHSHVQLLLGQLSRNIMLEEHPETEGMMRQQDDEHWVLDIDVVSFRGIGRFVLGLYNDISVLGDEDFKTYVHDEVMKMTNK